MLGSIYRIFLRYADEHAALDLKGCALTDASGAPVGAIERIRLRRNRLRLEGWAAVARIGIKVNRTQQWVLPDLARPGTDQRGFTLEIPFEPGEMIVMTETGGQAHQQVLPGISEARIRQARLAQALPYLGTLLSLAPQIRRWKLQGDLGAREVVKERLGLVPRSDAMEMESALLAPAPSAPDQAPARPGQTGATGVTLIMPVYNAFDVMPEALDRLDRHSDLPWRLILIEDCSPDGQVRPFVESWAADPARRGEVILLCNDENRGFIGSVNRGFETARQWPEDPVVLVNSDALVPEGWLSRLLAPLADPGVASVTPMSNDAEIFTVPVICQRNDLIPGAADALDAVARRFAPGAGRAEAPTGVGFCMAMAPDFLSRIPAFDTVFGRGYGEETDWCQKARQLGGRHVTAPDLFVEHRGGISFGSAEKQRLLQRNAGRISQRYPAYDQEVQDFIRNDPLTTPRLALGLAWAAWRQEAPVPVYLAHAMGGGAEHDLQARIAGDTDQDRSAVVLRVGQGHRWKLELHTPHGVTQGLSNDADLVQALVAHLPRRRIVYSCGVGDRDPLVLPDMLLRLAEGGHPVEVLMHDFFPLSPSYTLLGQDGVYRGVPVAGGPLAGDGVHRSERPGGVPVPLAEWQAAWGRLMGAAQRVTVFSQDSRALVAQAYPQALSALEVVPHRLRAAPPVIPSGWDGTGRPTIAALGNIGFHKGAAVLQRLSRDLARSGAADLVVIGNVDPAYPLARGTRVHGSYELRDLPGLVARYRIAAWLIPSIWPETFSFTTREALATGLPVFCFDLGAQGEAVSRAVAAGAPGGVLPLPQGASMDPAVILTGLRPADGARPVPTSAA